MGTDCPALRPCQQHTAGHRRAHPARNRPGPASPIPPRTSCSQRATDHRRGRGRAPRRPGRPRTRSRHPRQRLPGVAPRGLLHARSEPQRPRASPLHPAAQRDGEGRFHELRDQVLALLGSRPLRHADAAAAARSLRIDRTGLMTPKCSWWRAIVDSSGSRWESLSCPQSLIEDCERQPPGGGALPEGACAGALRGAATRAVVRGDWQDCDHECHSCHSATADRRRRGLSSTGSAGPHSDPSAPPPWGADVA